MSEHEAMTACKCAPEDRLTFCCLVCGRVFLWDPAWLIVIGATALFSWNIWAWVTL